MSQAWKQLFYTNAPLRPCCYECPWAKSGHVSDMTIGDFWGIEDVMPDFYNRMGVSAVLINTEKGEMAFECIKGKLEFREATFESMTVKNSNLIEPSISLTDREIFWGIYHEKGFGTLIWKYGCINYYYQFRRLIKNILKAIGVWEKG
jgi:hypothetical protein